MFLLDKPAELDNLVKHFRAQREKKNMNKVLPLFTKAKIWALEMGLDNVIKAQKTGKVDPKTGSFVLPLNIMEAVVAEVGSVLCRMVCQPAHTKLSENCGQVQREPVRGSGAVLQPPGTVGPAGSRTQGHIH